MDYKIIVAKALGPLLGANFDAAADKLAAEVRSQIALGWEPLGGVAAGQTGTLKVPYLFQAMIKRR